MSESSDVQDEQNEQKALDAFVAAHQNDGMGQIATKELFENERVRIWEMNLEPNEASDLHHHENDYLVILFEGDRIAAVPQPDSGKQPVVFPVEIGNAVFVKKGGTEWAFNLGNKRYREILIELKE